MPTWLKNAVIYQIFIDRFAGFDQDGDDTKPDFVGGNLRGITAKVPYLAALGVDAIWLTPFFSTTQYHGYATTDFYKVDPHFGDLADLKTLVATCHRAGIKVVMDFTANHTSDEHPFFVEAKNDPTSQYRQWYYFDHHNNYLQFLNFTSLPKLNLDFPAAREHIIGAAEYWIREADVDGLRLDHAIGPSDDFWRAFSARVHAVKPEIALVGEAVLFAVQKGHFKSYRIPHVRWFYLLAHLTPFAFDPLAKHYQSILDGCLDYTYYHLLKKFAAGNLTEAKFRQLLAKHYAAFRPDYALPVFMDNHDSDRYLYLVGQDYRRLKQALEIEFSLPRPKIIYYGDEVGMTHDKKVQINTGWAGDLPARQKMNWQPGAKEQELLTYYKDLIKRSKT